MVARSEFLGARLSRGDRLFDALNSIFLFLVLISVLYPLYFVLIASVSDPTEVNTGKVWLVPKGVSLEGYKKIFEDQEIWRGYRNTIVYSVLGTAINLILTLPAAYALSRKDLRGRNAVMFGIAFTMFFHGGLIPTYLLIRSLGMVNTIWAMVIPEAVVAWNLIVSRTYFQSSIPDEILEAAIIDGCSNTRFFAQVVMPLSKAILSVMLLFYGVAHWNEFFRALIYLRDKQLYPLQLILREILIQHRVSDEALHVGDLEMAHLARDVAELIKYGVIVVASLPVLILYPFLQKYFVQGVMIGAIKG